MSAFAGHYSYWITIVLMVAGMYILTARGNLLKKLLGLAVLQSSVYLLYIAPGKLIGGTAPIVAAGHASIVAGMAGIRLPLQSHPLQALVSELLEPVHPNVVMSNAVHVYVIDESWTVDDTEVGVLAPTSEPIVTLITCAGDWNPYEHSYNKRLVVRGHYAAVEPRSGEQP